MTRHPSLQGHPEVDWARYEAELRTPDRCGQWLAVVIVLLSWVPIVALVVWWRR